MDQKYPCETCPLRGKYDKNQFLPGLEGIFYPSGRGDEGGAEGEIRI